MLRRLVFALLPLVACSSDTSDSNGSGGGTSSSTTSSTSSSSTAESTSTGQDLEAACAARVAPDCGDAFVTGCGLVSGYSFEATVGACTTPDADCTGATPIERCLFIPPGSPMMQSEILIHRDVGSETEVVHLSSWPVGGIAGWTMSCDDGPACPGWEDY